MGPMIGSLSGSLPSRVLAAHRGEVLDLAEARGGSNVRVFGSVARGEDSPSSDIDLLVDFAPGTSLLTVIGLELALRELLGVPVDVGPADALREDMRDQVLTSLGMLEVSGGSGIFVGLSVPGDQVHLPAPV